MWTVQQLGIDVVKFVYIDMLFWCQSITVWKNIQDFSNKTLQLRQGVTVKSESTKNFIAFRWITVWMLVFQQESTLPSLI